jgi:hypothetical protein
MIFLPWPRFGIGCMRSKSDYLECCHLSCTRIGLGFYSFFHTTRPGLHLHELAWHCRQIETIDWVCEPVSLETRLETSTDCLDYNFPWTSCELIASGRDHVPRWQHCNRDGENPADLRRYHLPLYLRAFVPSYLRTFVGFVPSYLRTDVGMCNPTATCKEKPMIWPMNILDFGRRSTRETRAKLGVCSFSGQSCPHFT